MILYTSDPTTLNKTVEVFINDTDYNDLYKYVTYE